MSGNGQSRQPCLTDIFITNHQLPSNKILMFICPWIGGRDPSSCHRYCKSDSFHQTFGSSEHESTPNFCHPATQRFTVILYTLHRMPLPFTRRWFESFRYPSGNVAINISIGDVSKGGRATRQALFMKDSVTPQVRTPEDFGVGRGIQTAVGLLLFTILWLLSCSSAHVMSQQ